MTKSTRNVLIVLILIFTFNIISSCNNKELSNPETVKGMKLGLDLDLMSKIGEENGMCENDLPKSRVCQYKLIDDVYARPGLYYSLFNNKKVLGKVILILDSPTYFPKIESIGGDEVIAEYPSITKSQLDEIILMYKTKYGKGITDIRGEGGWIDWISGDLFIRLSFYKATHQYIPIHPQIKMFFQTDAYATEIKYEYMENMKSLLKNEITHNGEPIGDKI